MRELEQRGHGHLEPQPLPEPGHHLGGQQGMAAQGEEVVVGPTWSRCSTSDQISAIWRSRSVLGGRDGSGAGASRAGTASRAARSILPLPVSGSASSTSRRAGTRAAGSWLVR